MNALILAYIAGGAIYGAFVSIIPSRKVAIAFLCLVPIAMILFVYVEQSDPSRRPDALDVLAYVFGPLWPSLGAAVSYAYFRTLQENSD